MCVSFCFWTTRTERDDRGGSQQRRSRADKKVVYLHDNIIKKTRAKSSRCQQRNVWRRQRRSVRNNFSLIKKYFSYFSVSCVWFLLSFQPPRQLRGPRVSNQNESESFTFHQLSSASAVMNEPLRKMCNFPSGRMGGECDSTAKNQEKSVKFQHAHKRIIVALSWAVVDE